MFVSIYIIYHIVFFIEYVHVYILSYLMGLCIYLCTLYVHFSNCFHVIYYFLILPYGTVLYCTCSYLYWEHSLTSWLVLLLGQEFTFTKWGIVSGLFWVPGGAFNIFAIRNAGLAISQGIVASSIVMVSFVWGNLVFREPVKSQMAAYFAVWLIMAGLYGMSYFSTAETLSSESSSNDLHRTDEEKEEEQQDLMQKRSDSFDNDASITEPLEIQQQQQPIGNRRSILILGKTYSRRNLGLLSALMCGLWGGSCLVPMHYSTGDTNGLGYVISFSIGALLVTIMLWILRYLHQLFKLGSVREAYAVLPSFHFR